MKNEAKLKQMGLEGKPKFYYLKYGQNSHGHALLGVATVCVIQVPGTSILFVRGVAFCNPLDQFNRKHGCAIALGRVIKAIERREYSELIPKKKPAWILERMMGWAYFSTWDITLTDYEKKMFKDVPKTSV